MKRNLSRFFILVIIFSVALFWACKKDSTNYTSPSEPVDQMVTASLQGRVLDENGLPVKDAAVMSGTATTVTDMNGVFSFSDIQLSSRFGYVKVSKTGYFMGSRSILTHAGAGNYVEIVLLPRVSKGSFAAGTGGTIIVQGNNSVSFPAGAIVTAAGNAAYSGNVHVFATWLDPTDTNLDRHMPGTLRGIDKANQETGLQSFGMMAVELEGDAGEKLQIASGKTATITMAVPASLLGSAPASIPLWYFNDSTGKWLEEGSASLQGGNYTGQVTHFTYWNCDAPIGTVFFKLYLKDQYGNPMAYTYVRFVSVDLGARGGMTDSSGYTQGMILRGTTLVMQVLNRCGDVIYSQHVGAASNDQNLGTSVITLAPTILTLTGTAVDCGNNPVANGFVNAYVEGLNYRTAVLNGQFTLILNRCSAETASMLVTAGDYGTNQQGNSTAFTATNGSLDLGQLSACGQTLDQWVNIHFNGVNYSIGVPSDSISYGGQGSYFQFSAYSNPQNNSFLSLSMWISPLSGAGTVAVNGFFMAAGSSLYKSSINTPLQCTVSTYGNINEFVLGTLSGSIRDTITNVDYSMTGSFKVKRTN